MCIRDSVHTAGEKVIPDYTIPFNSLLIKTIGDGMAGMSAPTLEPLWYIHPLLTKEWPSWIPHPDEQLVRPCKLAYHALSYSAGGKQKSAVRKCLNHPQALQFVARRTGVVSKLAAFEGMAVKVLQCLNNESLPANTYAVCEEEFLGRLGLANWLYVEETGRGSYNGERH